MTTQPKMFRINPETKESQPVEEVEFARLGLQERRDIQEWVANNPSILGDDLLIIGKEFSGFDLTNERLDLLAVDPDGQLVIIELKRDDSGSDAHWQAIKYASYFRQATAENLVKMLSDYGEMSEEESFQKLIEQLNADDLNSLNHSQRIILASHRFGPEVTSAALWLNDEANRDLITCVQLIPYHDPGADSLYIQAHTIIPVPDTEGLQVGIGDGPKQPSSGINNSFAENLTRTYQRSINHEATGFFQQVGQITLSSLPPEIRPTRRSKWAGQQGGGTGRSYNLWYSEPPWSNWGVSYRFNLWQTDRPEEWDAQVSFVHNDAGLAEALDGIVVHQDQQADESKIAVWLAPGSLSDANFAERLAGTMSGFIETITPIVNQYHDDATNAEDA